MDYRHEGEKLWCRFNGGKQGTLWYYRALVNAFGRAKRIRLLLEEMDRVLTELESLVNNQGPLGVHSGSAKNRLQNAAEL
jgi:GTP pyrophosphokinase